MISNDQIVVMSKRTKRQLRERYSIEELTQTINAIENSANLQVKISKYRIFCARMKNAIERKQLDAKDREAMDVIQIRRIEK